MSFVCCDFLLKLMAFRKGSFFLGGVPALSIKLDIVTNILPSI